MEYLSQHAPRYFSTTTFVAPPCRVTCGRRFTLCAISAPLVNDSSVASLERLVVVGFEYRGEFGLVSTVGLENDGRQWLGEQVALSDGQRGHLYHRAERIAFAAP
jgi:hypothetical protein